MGRRLQRPDLAIALGAVAAVILLALEGSVTTSLDLWAYDQGVRQASADPGDAVVVVEIDNNSIAKLGRWPWPRNVLARMVGKLDEAGASAVVSGVFLSEPQEDPGLRTLSELESAFSSLGVDGPEGEEFASRLSRAIAELDHDSQLEAALAGSGGVLLPMYADYAGGRSTSPADADPALTTIAASPILAGDGRVASALRAGSVQAPLPRFARHALAVGTLLTPTDIDGKVRTEPLALAYTDGQFLPSLSLVAAAAGLGLRPEDIQVGPGPEIHVGDKRTIGTDPNYFMATAFYRPQAAGIPAFQTFSFVNVLTENGVSLAAFRDKVVIIGATATGVATSLPTPIGEQAGAVSLLAHNIASILNEDFFLTPAMGPAITWGAFGFVGLYLLLLLPRLGAGPAAGVSAVLLVLLAGSELVLLMQQGLWLKMMVPTLLLVVGHLALTTRRFLATETAKQQADAASAVSNRALGLQYQSEGKLDMALDAFRRCPMDEQLMDNLYTLALDFERKRLFAKALNTYSLIAEHQPEFRDIREKIQRSKNLEETMLIGGARPGGPGPSLLTGDGITKPTLGKYEIEKELGKGAMGIVYLGRDPKINRTVAIKTLALSQEFDEDEIDEVKQRFFREAETAGNLNHPNIVTIHDVGEEHDLAYIAMEFLSGHDLTRYTKPANLLPVSTVLGIVFRACQALDEAHRNNVVHRDIKPANIMYEPTTRQIKITDFGIARITDASKTRTGVVLGTPSYMSPEQLSGKKVDGRSDLFSLGVMLYQLLTGRLPFGGDSMATLMYRIANEPHPPLSLVRPELVEQRPCLAAIIDKALQKSATERYQSGLEMAKDLRDCARQDSAKT